MYLFGWTNQDETQHAPCDNDAARLVMSRHPSCRPSWCVRCCFDHRTKVVVISTLLYLLVYALPETDRMSCVTLFIVCFSSGTRQKSCLSCAGRKTHSINSAHCSHNESAPQNRAFALCPVNSTRQIVDLRPPIGHYEQARP